MAAFEQNLPWHVARIPFETRNNRAGDFGSFRKRIVRFVHGTAPCIASGYGWYKIPIDYRAN